jgi:carboxyl-terminal processing protease
MISQLLSAKRIAVLIFTLLLTAALAQSDQTGGQKNGQASYKVRFMAAWNLVEQRYWDIGPMENWQQVRKEFEPKALAAKDDAQFYAVLKAMYATLNDGHSVFVPPSEVKEIHQEYGDLPCLGVFSFSLADSSDNPTRTLGHVSYKVVGGNIGYMRVPDLATAGTANDVRKAVKNLSQQQVMGFILDLRDNPGGRLTEMMRTAGVFTGGLLWRTVTRWMLPLPYPAIGPVATKLPLAVLINGGVNSAAEGLAGGLKEAHRATIVGEKSAGNVEAVLPFCFKDGSQAWIATGVLAPLTGATWEGRGVTPNIPTKPGDEVKAAIKFLHGLPETPH